MSDADHHRDSHPGLPDGRALATLVHEAIAEAAALCEEWIGRRQLQGFLRIADTDDVQDVRRWDEARELYGPFGSTIIDLWVLLERSVEIEANLGPEGGFQRTVGEWFFWEVCDPVARTVLNRLLMIRTDGFQYLGGYVEMMEAIQEERYAIETEIGGPVETITINDVVASIFRGELQLSRLENVCALE